MNIGEPIRRLTVVPLEHPVPASAPEQDVPAEPERRAAPAKRELEPVER